MSRGYLLFAHNNPQIDYIKLALINALMIKKNTPGANVALVADGSINYLLSRYSRDLIDYAFTHIVYDEIKDGRNLRTYKGGTEHSPVEFLNSSRPSAYELSPWDETILVDVDYLIMDDTLESCWGSVEEIMINKRVKFLNHREGEHEDARLDQMGIPTYWATAIYFSRTERCRLLFALVEQIRLHYEFYQILYQFPGRMYRNDYAFSIALHMMNGFVENGTFVRPLPVPFIYASPDSDMLLEVKGINQLVFKTHMPDVKAPIPVVISDMNVHVMNKYAILAHAEKLISLYTPEGIQIHA